MPFYEIFHVYPLTPTQRRELAEQITTLHCTTFSVPSAFVNVVLYYCSNKEGSKSDDRAMFVGGKEVRILVRSYYHSSVFVRRWLPPGYAVHVYCKLPLSCIVSHPRGTRG